MLATIRLRFTLIAAIAATLAALVATGTTENLFASFNTADIPGWPHAATPSVTQPFEPGGALHCSGVEAMTPRQAGSTMRRMGYHVFWLLDGVADPMEARVTSPPKRSVLRAIAAQPGSSYGSYGVPDGGAIMFVAPARTPQAASGWAMSLPAQVCG